MITPQELGDALKKIGKRKSAEKIAQIIKKVDYIGNGKINYSEFLAATVNVKVLLNDNLLMSLFQRFDIDNSGYITKENLKEAFARSGMVTNILTDL